MTKLIIISSLLVALSFLCGFIYGKRSFKASIIFIPLETLIGMSRSDDPLSVVKINEKGEN